MIPAPSAVRWGRQTELAMANFPISGEPMPRRIIEAIAITARYLAENPVTRGSTQEMRLQDPFDYGAEDRIIDAYQSLLATARPFAERYDPDFRDRYAPGSGDWRLVEPRS